MFIYVAVDSVTGLCPFECAAFSSTGTEVDEKAAMTKANGKSLKAESTEQKNEPGSLLQIGETLQTVIVGVLDGTSTIFRSVLGTFKDSAVFAIRSTKEVSDEIGKSLKSSILGTIEGTHEVSTKAANTFGKTLVDLSQCTYNTGAKVGNITKAAALNTIQGTAEITEELFGKIKSGVGSVINLDRIRLDKKKVINGPSEPVENN